MGEGKEGFSLLEVLIVIALLSVIIMMGSETFMAIVKGSKKETGSASTQIESILSLNVIRYDVEHAGYGICKGFLGGINYQEAVDSEGANYNDAPSGVPRPILSGNNVGFNSSDRLVVKSVLVGTNETCTKWTYVRFGEAPKTWDNYKINLQNGERVIVIKPCGPDKIDRLVVSSDGSFFTLFSSSGLGPDFTPKAPNEKYIIYGVDPDSPLRMPFNRADYFVMRPSSGIPVRCAPNTGILYKANLNHANGRFTYMPIMDCVADFQVIFGIDTNGDKIVDSYVDDISGYDASTIRNRVKEVRIYILTHEGGMDRDSSYGEKKIYVGEFGRGREFDLSLMIGGNWQNFRWKVYSVVIKLRNL